MNDVARLISPKRVGGSDADLEHRCRQVGAQRSLRTRVTGLKSLDVGIWTHDTTCSLHRRSNGVNCTDVLHSWLWYELPLWCFVCRLRPKTIMQN